MNFGSYLPNQVEIIEGIQPSAVLEYRLAQNEGYDEVIEAATFCSTEPNYLFEIYISEPNYSDSAFIEQLIETLNIDKERLAPPYFYWPFYKKYRKTRLYPQEYKQRTTKRFPDSE